VKDVNDRIIDVAIELAEEGGFENVRQRDVAKQAGIALGTLYKRFRSKEDILAAAVARQTKLLETFLEINPVQGATATDRASALFEVCTRGMCLKPHYARAVLRAVASGVPETAQSVTLYHGRMSRLIVTALRGTSSDEPASETESMLGLLLQQVWFASLVGWSAGLHDVDAVIAQTTNATGLLLRAVDYSPQSPDRD
jgi:AcrR family transcriptional regulator